MPIQKPNDPKASPGNPPQMAGKPERKAWKKKSPVEVVLEQADKLKVDIAGMEEDLKAKRRQLVKFEEARKLFEAM